MIDFTTVLTDLAGNALVDVIAQEANGGRAEPLTLGHAASHALCFAFLDEGNVPGQEKYDRAALAVRIRDANAAALTLQERALVQQLIEKLYGPIVVYRARPLLDPPAAPAKPLPRELPDARRRSAKP